MRGLMPVRTSALLSVVALSCGLLAAITVAATPASAVTSTLPGYTALSPQRICDTRAASPGLVVANQCDTDGHSPLGPGGILKITVANVGSVPADATAVVLHVTVTNTSTSSYLTVWPTTSTMPTASNINWTAGQTVPNLVQTAVGTLGRVSIFNALGTTDVIVDLEGYFEVGTGSLFVNTDSPTRVCDTRVDATANPCNNNGTASGALGPSGEKVVNVTSGAGIPSGATAVVLNVTVTDTTASSFLDVWPDLQSPPLASVLNWVPGETIPNRVMVPISAAGNIDVANDLGSTDVVIDVDGYFSPSAAGGSGYFPLNPERTCDTRPSGPGVAANACDPPEGGGTVPPEEGFSLNYPSLPAGITAFVTNTTVTDTASDGFLVVFPDDDANTPLASDLNWTPNETIANLTIADLGSTATFDVGNGSSGSTDIIIDVDGAYSTTDLNASAIAAPHARSRR